jgi:hypothetical protein
MAPFKLQHHTAQHEVVLDYEAQTFLVGSALTKGRRPHVLQPLTSTLARGIGCGSTTCCGESIALQNKLSVLEVV